jgi:phosphocarrier protein FPr/phosphocarrier protein
VGELLEGRATISMAHGLHARPAARLTAALKPFKANVRLFAHGRDVNARSTVALLTLGLHQGDEVSIRSSGPDAAAALAAAKDMLDIHPGEDESGVYAPSAARTDEAINPPARSTLFKGVSAAPGIAIGQIVQLRVSEPEVTERGLDPQSELAILDKARAELGVELGRPHSAESRDIGDAHRSLLEDPDLLESARSMIMAGSSAGFAWRSAIRAQMLAIRATGNARLMERADDLLDIERRIILKIRGGEAERQQIPAGALLVTDNLLPSQFMALKQGEVTGIVTAHGGPTSHVAILAASAGIPMLVAAGEGVLAIAEGGLAILDATRGTLDADPTPAAIATSQEQIRHRKRSHAVSASESELDCVMADGTRIDVFANLASVDDAERAVGMGAEGCGLLRTEFLFLDRSEAPSEEEQREVYARIAAALEGRPLIVRTLDIGGDKPVPYIPFPHEDNPALGRRGVRLSLFRPDLLATQLRAVLAAVPAKQCRIMVPMIVDVEELRAVRTVFNEAARIVGVAENIPLGIMVETPSAALLAESLSKEADFLSVGTNDLSQYTLAVDRGNDAVAAKVDALHPAVLRLIAEAGRGALANGRWLGVCGGLASDPTAAALLVGLGATELSAVPTAVSQVKASVRKLTMEQCRSLAQQALKAGTAAEVRAILEGQE